MLQEVALGALQAWQSVSEATGRGHEDRQMAVLFTDLVGFSSWALQAGDELALEMRRGRLGRRVDVRRRLAAGSSSATATG